MLAVWTGQRQGDLLDLTWSAYDGAQLRVKQSKGGRRVLVPEAGPLKLVLDNAAKNKKTLTILSTTQNTPWTSDGFRTSWGKAIKKQGYPELLFMISEARL